MWGFCFSIFCHIPLHWAVLNLFGSWWLEWVHYPVTSFTLWSVSTQSAGAAALLDVRIIPKTLQSEPEGYNQRNWDKLAVTFADGVLPLTVRDQLNDLTQSSKGNWDWPSCKNKTSTTKCLLFSTYHSLHYKTAQSYILSFNWGVTLFPPKCRCLHRVCGNATASYSNICLHTLAIMWLLKPFHHKNAHQKAP